MRTIKALLLTGSLLALPLPALAGSAGADPFNFLFLDANARAVGLSGAYTARATDVNALLYNPAGLARVRRNQATFMHNQYFQDITQEYLGFASAAGWGASFNYLSFGDIPNTTISNHTGSGLGSFGVSDMALSAGYGYGLTDDLAVGAGVKLVREAVDDVSGQGFGLDIGALYSMPMIDGLTLGGALQNMGPKVKFESAEENLPMNLRLGAAYAFELLGQESSVSLDLTKERSEDVLTSLGVETVIAQAYPVRLGYNTRNNDGPGITAGLGYLYKNLSFDYAFAPFKELGAAHRLSVTLFWGGEKKIEASVPQNRMKPVQAAVPSAVSLTTAATAAGEENQDRLIQDLGDASWQIRVNAVLELAKLKSEPAVNALLEALTDDDDRVAGSAAKALGRIRTAKALRPLMAALNDASSYVRASAAKGLGYLGDKRAKASLKQALSDESRSVKKAVSDALISIGE